MEDSFNYRCALSWEKSAVHEEVNCFRKFSKVRIIDLPVVACVMDYCVSPKEREEGEGERERGEKRPILCHATAGIVWPPRESEQVPF